MVITIIVSVVIFVFGFYALDRLHKECSKREARKRMARHAERCPYEVPAPQLKMYLRKED